MNRSVLNINDHNSDKELFLENVLSLSVVNTGVFNVEVNGVLIKPKEQFDFVKPDNSVCDFKLNPKFSSGLNEYFDAPNSYPFTDLQGNVTLLRQNNTQTDYRISGIDDSFNRMNFGKSDNPSDYLVGPFHYFIRKDGKKYVAVQDPQAPLWYYICEYQSLFVADVSNFQQSIIKALNIDIEPVKNVKRIQLIYKKLI